MMVTGSDLLDLLVALIRKDYRDGLRCELNGLTSDGVLILLQVLHAFLLFITYLHLWLLIG